MDNSSDTNNDQNQSLLNNLKIVKLLIWCGLFIVGLIAGIILGSLFKKDTPANTTVSEPVPAEVINSYDSFDPTNTLTSPVFTEWLGSVEGEVVSKSENSFTIQKDGQKLEIVIQPALTLFFDERNGPVGAPQLQLNDLQEGMYVRGAVTISRGTLSGDLNEHVFANAFSVINAPKP